MYWYTVGLTEDKSYIAGPYISRYLAKKVVSRTNFIHYKIYKLAIKSSPKAVQCVKKRMERDRKEWEQYGVMFNDVKGRV